MTLCRKLMVFALLMGCLPAPGSAAEATNKSFEGKYKTMARFCTGERCDEQAESLSSAFFIGPRNAYIYSGANKGMVVPFGRRLVSADGKSVWIVPTRAGFDETYARDGFTITHHYAMRPDGTCSISVSVVQAPARMNTTYKTDVESCKVAEGDTFAAR